MKWTDEKVEQLLDEYEYCDLIELSEKLGCTVKALTRKAEKLHLFRAKNNEVKDGIKYCTFCKTYHDESEFYKDRAKNSDLRYNCKLYYQNYKLKNKKQNLNLTPTLLNQKRGKESNRGVFEGSSESCKKEKIKHRPISPVVKRNGIEGKVCNGCKEWKPLESYGKDKKGIAGRRARCVDCMRKMYRK